MWSSQFEGEKGDVKGSYEGRELKLHVQEVMGSRGRMSNYTALSTAVRKGNH